jgi:multidrug efflux pump subunit AcrA (membrane-fusion protein)
VRAATVFLTALLAAGCSKEAPPPQRPPPQVTVLAADLDRAQGEHDSAAAAVFSAQAKVKEQQLNLGYATIQAPVTGSPAARRSARARTSTPCPRARR